MTKKDIMKIIIQEYLYPIYGEELAKSLLDDSFKILDNGEFYWDNSNYFKAKGLVTRGGVVVRQTHSYLKDPSDLTMGMIQRDSVYIVNVEGANFIAENEISYTIDSIDGTESKIIERNKSAKAIDDIYSISLTIANEIAHGDGFSELVYGEPRAQRIEVLNSSKDFTRVLK